jgi:hypothetical protein
MSQLVNTYISRKNYVYFLRFDHVAKIL